MCLHNPNDFFHFYTIPNGDMAGLVWALNPPIATFNGPNTGATVLVNFSQSGTTQLCATPTNPCYDPTPICLDLDVRPLPSINNHPGILYACHGQHVYYELTGDAAYFRWGISICTEGPISKEGPLDFIAKNPGNTPIECWITMGAYHDPECHSYPIPLKLVVYPRPTLNTQNIQDITVCGGESISLPFSGTHNTGYAWTNDNPAIGLPASGTGNINFVATKAPQTETATVTVAPTTDICTGDPVTFSITVQGSNMTKPPDIIVCPGDQVKVPFSGNATEGYAWANNMPGIGLDGSGMGDIAFIAEGGASQQVATVTVWPQPCPFAPVSFNITVRPRATATALPDTTVCAGDTLALTLTGSPGTQFHWTNSNPAIGLDTAGNAPNLLVLAPQAVDSARTGIVTVTPLRQGCTGQPMSFSITVKKCCATTAGTLDTAAVTVCGPDKTIALPLPKGYHLEPGDTLRYALYSNPANPLGSIVQYSDTLLFHFLPDSMQLDSTYFVAVLAGPLAPGDSLLLDAAAKCFSLHKGPKVRWAKKPAMAVAVPPEAVCGDGCVNVQFDLAGTPPFEFTWQVVQNGQVLLSRDETVATGHQHVVTVCPQDFAVPTAANEPVQFRVVWLVDRDCGCFD